MAQCNYYSRSYGAPSQSSPSSSSRSGFHRRAVKPLSSWAFKPEGGIGFPVLGQFISQKCHRNFTNGTDRIRLPRISFLGSAPCRGQQEPVKTNVLDAALLRKNEIGRASCRERAQI